MPRKLPARRARPVQEVIPLGPSNALARPAAPYDPEANTDLTEPVVLTGEIAQAWRAFCAEQLLPPTTTLAALVRQHLTAVAFPTGATATEAAS